MVKDALGGAERSVYVLLAEYVVSVHVSAAWQVRKKNFSLMSCCECQFVQSRERREGSTSRDLKRSL